MFMSVLCVKAVDKNSIPVLHKDYLCCANNEVEKKRHH